MGDDANRLSENADTLIKYQQLLESGAISKDEFDNVKAALLATEDGNEPKCDLDTSGEHAPNQITVSFEWDNDGRLVTYTTETGTDKREEYGRFLKPVDQDDHSFCSDVAEMIERDLRKTVRWTMPNDGRRESKVQSRSNGKHGQAKKERVSKSRSVVVAVLCIAALAVVLMLLTSNSGVVSSSKQSTKGTRSDTPMFASENEMREKVAGVYTEKLDEDYMIKISDDTMTRRHGKGQDITDETYRIVSYDPENGVINLENDVVAVTKDGGLYYRFGYDRGGVWEDDPSSQESSGSSTQSSSATTPTFTFGDIRWKISDTGSYVTYSSSITNNSSMSYKFVEVRFTFYDENSNVIDTDWTYAVGSEGIRPGETSQFDLMRKNDISESRIGLEVINYK